MPSDADVDQAVDGGHTEILLTPEAIDGGTELVGRSSARTGWGGAARPSRRPLNEHRIDAEFLVEVTDHRGKGATRAFTISDRMRRRGGPANIALKPDRGTAMRRSVPVWIAALAIIAAPVLTTPAAHTDESDDAYERALSAWVPVQLPEDAHAVAPESFDASTLDSCETGQSLGWTADGVVVASLVWMGCGTADAAAQRLSAAWANSAMFPDASASALGEDVELTAAAFESGGQRMLYRLWTQGEYYLAVGRACGDGDTECADRSATDAVSAQDLSRSTSNALALAAPIDGDLLADFVPTDDAGWMIKHSRPANTTVGDGTLGRCGDGVGTRFVNDRGHWVQAFWVDCGTVATAQAFGVDTWPKPDAAGLLPFKEAWYGVSRSEPEGVPAIARWWVQGTHYYEVIRTCGDVGEAVCAQLTVDYARAIEPLLRGAVEPLAQWNKAIWALVILIGVPIATYLLILIPRRVVASRRQREEAPRPQEAKDAVYIAVDDLVRRVRRGRIVRRTIIVAAASVVSLVLIEWALLEGEFFAQVVTLFAAPIVTFFVISWLLELIWQPHRLLRPPRPRRRPSLRAVVGTTLRGLAVFLAAGILMLYVLSVLLTWLNGLGTADNFLSRIEDQIKATEGLGKLFPLAQRGLWELSQSGWIAVLYLVAVAIPIFLIYLLDRVGRRLARRSLQDTLAQDRRPYFLYLRGFDEDRLRIDESLGRRGFLELFSLFGRPRFEEVLAEHLSTFGPVIAISGSTQRLQDLGAVKISLSGDRWQDQVREWVGGARAVVLSATPSEVRAGLEWEIAHLASRPDAPPFLLVISPWPRAERQRRWDGFLASASAWPMFLKLVEHPAPSATNILTYSAERGWVSYGATRRWDWSYAASILCAIESGDFEREPSPWATEPELEPKPA